MIFWKFSAFSLEFQKFFSITRTIFSPSRSNNFGNKIPFYFFDFPFPFLWKRSEIYLMKLKSHKYLCTFQFDFIMVLIYSDPIVQLLLSIEWLFTILNKKWRFYQKKIFHVKKELWTHKIWKMISIFFYKNCTVQKLQLQICMCKSSAKHISIF